MAPVSMRPLAGMPFRQFLPHPGPSPAGAVGMAAVQYPDDAPRARAKARLLAVVRTDVRPPRFDPLAGDPIEQLRNAHLFRARRLFERRFPGPGQPPAVHVGLRHALQCSASDGSADTARSPCRPSGLAVTADLKVRTTSPDDLHWGR